jgi:hypothetical protein
VAQRREPPPDPARPAVAPAKLDDTCLPLVLPDAAVRIDRVGDRAAPEGGTGRGELPDVEIGDATALTGRADCVVVTEDVDAARRDGGARPVRVVTRVVDHARLRGRVAQHRRQLQRLGYGAVDVLLWDKGRPLDLTGGEGPVSRRFPLHAVIRGRRSAPVPTVFDAVLADAARYAGGPLRPRRVLARAGALVVLCDEHVLRVAIGAGTGRITHQADALVRLAGADLTPATRALLPRQVARDRHGAAGWSLETRVPGSTAPRACPWVEDRLGGLLVELFRSRAPVAPAPSTTCAAAVVAPVLPSGAAAALRRLATEVDTTVADLPRGVAHGDLFHGNVLVRDDAVTGIVDWDSATSQQLPLLDLFHLAVCGRAPRGSVHWGPALVDLLLPAVRRGGTPVWREHADQLGFDASPAVLEALVAAYWLDRLSYQVTRYADRRSRGVWLDRNVHRVLAALTA